MAARSVVVNLDRKKLLLVPYPEPHGTTYVSGTCSLPVTKNRYRVRVTVEPSQPITAHHSCIRRS